MNKFISLTKINLIAAFRQISFIRRRGANKHGAAFVGLIGIVLLALMAYGGWIAYNISTLLHPMGLDWLVLAALFFIITFFVFSTSIYTVNSVLFESADTDQLFAYPMPKYQILFSKILGLAIENWLVSLVLSLPFIGVYCYYVNPPFIFYTYVLICIIISPLIPLCLISIISYLVSALSSGTQLKNYLNLFLTIIMFVGVTVGITKATKYLGNSYTSSADILYSIKLFYPPIGYIVAALYKYNPLDMIIAIAWNSIPFVLLCSLLSMFYAPLRSRIVATKKVKGGKLTFSKSSKLVTLTKKEFSRFLHSPMYILNSCIGIILITFFAISSNSLGKNLKHLFSTLIAMGATSTQIVLVVFLFILSTANITAPSISLEGKNLWILKSFPVKPHEIFKAKLMVHLITIIPFVIIDCIIVSITMHTGFSGFAVILFTCVLFVILGGLVGLIYNLYYHRFDFYNDMQVVKNSASVLLTLITQFATVAAFIFVYWLISKLATVNFVFYDILVMLIMFSVIIYLYNYLCKKCERLFLQLE